MYVRVHPPELCEDTYKKARLDVFLYVQIESEAFCLLCYHGDSGRQGEEFGFQIRQSGYEESDWFPLSSDPSRLGGAHCTFPQSARGRRGLPHNLGRDCVRLYHEAGLLADAQYLTHLATNCRKKWRTCKSASEFQIFALLPTVHSESL